MNIAESKILITGGAKGIGHHLAVALADKVAGVIVLDNDQAALNALPTNPGIQALHCDITDPAAVESVVRRIFDEMGGVNVCVNNAGLIHSEPLINLLASGDKRHSLENWRKVMQVNLDAVFFVGLNVAEQMTKRRQAGVIINISSIAAQGNVGQSAYAASKAAVEALTKTWSKELGMFKVRCACIAPGFFDTPSTHQGLNSHVLDRWKKSVPLGRLGGLSEIQSAVEFIIQNDYFNGKVLALDGGLTI